jgi:hypothetical protein
MALKINELENGEGFDHPMLRNYKMKREAFKDKKLTKHFVEALLKKLEIPEQTIGRCLKVPLTTYAKILDLVHLIVNGKIGLGRLGDLRELLCDELKVIPNRLKDPKIMNDIKNYLTRHIKSLTR